MFQLRWFGFLTGVSELVQVQVCGPWLRRCNYTQWNAVLLWGAATSHGVHGTRACSIWGHRLPNGWHDLSTCACVYAFLSLKPMGTGWRVNWLFWMPACLFGATVSFPLWWSCRKWVAHFMFQFFLTCISEHGLSCRRRVSLHYVTWSDASFLATSSTSSSI
jgi:hypothetical protein